MKKYIISILLILLSITYIHSYEIYTPYDKDFTQKDIYTEWWKGWWFEYVVSETSPKSKQSYWRTRILLINQYLWLIIGSISFGVALYAGITIMIATGDEASVKKANKALIYGIIGILVALIAYIAVKLIITIY